MATLTIGEIKEYGVTREHTATDWQVSSDPEFKNLVLDVKKDKINLKKIRRPLLNNDGSYYYPYYGSYARARVWYGEFASGWFIINMESCPQPDTE